MAQRDEPVGAVPLLTCRRCGAPAPQRPAPSFSTGNYLVWRCECGPYGGTELPALTKKVLYLDTSVLSNIHDSISKERDDRWTRLFRLLDDAVREQAVVCPRSYHHVVELELTPKAADIASLTEPLTGWLEFRHFDTIRRFQADLAFDRWVAGSMVEVPIPDSTGFERSPHRWVDRRGYIARPQRGDHLTLQRRREAKESAVRGLERLRDTRLRKRIAFDEILEAERSFLGEHLWQAHRLYEARLSGVMLGLHDEPEILVEAEQHAVVSDLLRRTREGVFGKADYESVHKFLVDGGFADIPCESLHSRLWAVLGTRHVAAKHAPRVKPGDTYDVGAIGFYAPYCHAMVLDGAMADLARHPKVKLREICGREVAVFNGRGDLADLSEWIEQQRDATPVDVREAGLRLYTADATRHLLGWRP